MRSPRSQVHWPAPVSSARFTSDCRSRWRSRPSRLGPAKAERRGQILLRLLQDLDNPIAVGGEARVPWRTHTTRQHLPQPLIDRALGGRWQSLERLRVDHVAARVREETLLQIEVAERPAFAVTRSALAKGLR